jgi:hypothetical protein
MKATYEREDEITCEWIEETIDTDNLCNDSGEEWTEEMLYNYLCSVCGESSIRDFELI